MPPSKRLYGHCGGHFYSSGGTMQASGPSPDATVNVAVEHRATSESGYSRALRKRAPEWSVVAVGCITVPHIVALIVHIVARRAAVTRHTGAA